MRGRDLVRNCGCYRTGIYCSPACVGPAAFAWYSASEAPAVSAEIEHKRREALARSSSSSSGGGSSQQQQQKQPPPPVAPAYLPHFYAVESLRAAVRDLWTSTALVDVIPEHSKLVVVDSRLSLHTLIRVLIEYKKAFLLLFCEETGTVRGIFSFHDVLAYLLYYHHWITDRNYQRRVCEALADYSAVPDLLFAPEDLENVVDASLPASSSSVVPVGGGGSSTTSSVVAALRDLEPAAAGVNTMGSIDSVRTSISSKDGEGLYRRRSTGCPDAKQLPRLETLAVLVTQQHGELLLPLPCWFSVRLFEDRRMTLAAFRKLVAATGAPPGATHAAAREGDQKLFLVPPPWLLSLTLWRRLDGFSSSAGLLGIDPLQPPLEAAMLITRKQSEQLTVTVWNAARQIPLNAVGAYSLLNHCLQHLRGDHPALNLLVLEDLGLGVPGEEVVSVHPGESLESVLTKMRETCFSCLPIVSPVDGSFLGFFNRTHVMAMLSRSLQVSYALRPHLLGRGEHEGGVAAPEQETGEIDNVLCLDHSLETLMMRLFNYNVNNTTFALHTYQSTAKFFAAAGENKQTACAEGRTVLDPATYKRLAGPEGLPAVSLANLLASHGLSLHMAAPCVLNSYVCSAAVIDPDLRLRDAIAHVLQVESHRLVLVDAVDQRVRRLITAGDLLAFLIGHCCDGALS